MEFSFERGDPIARIEGGTLDGKIIHIYDPNKKCCEKCTETCLTKKRRCCQKCEMKNGGCGCTQGGKIMTDYDSLLDGIPTMTKEDIGNNLKKIKEYLLKEFEQHKNKGPDQRFNIKLDNLGKIIPLPMKEPRQIEYVSAPSGAGKSTWTAKYSNEYRKMFPNNPIYVISRLDEDKVIDEIPNVNRIKINQELVDDPIDPITELKDSLVIFDDIDTLREPVLKKEVQKLRNDILEIGRHPSTHCVNTSHMLMNYGESRGIINESHQVTIFPEFTPTHHMDRYLKTYAGLSNEQIDMVKNLGSRWVTINQKGPRYLLYDKGAMLINKVKLPKIPERRGRKKKVSSDTIEDGSEEEIQ